MDDDEKIKISGTKIILHIKENSSKYLQQYTLSELLTKYSEFIEFPIHLWKETTEYTKEIDTEASKSLKEGEEPKMKTVPKKTLGYNKLNNQKPIWLRSPKEVNQEEYEKFYKSSFRAAYDDPQKWAHFALEGSVEFKALLYIPGMLPFELSKDMFDENTRNIRLYVKRVFINDKFEGIMPRWLNFIRGVVDSNDLPLNVSREILQRSRVLNIINKKLVRKSLDMFRDLASDTDESKYNTFWNNFGKYLKVGVVEDQRNKEDIIPLLRFWSVKSGDKYTSLDAYVDEMPEGQKSIYYVSNLTPPQKMMWTNGNALLFKSLITYTVAPFQDNDCLFTMTEKLYGTMAPLILGYMPDFDDTFSQFALDLKNEAEVIQKANNLISSLKK
jgi:heat shock protein beta